MNEKIEEQACQLNQEALVADGLGSAMIGVVINKYGQYVVAYSIPKIIDIFIENGMTYEEAEEYFEFNVEGAHMGDGTPVYLDVLDIVSLKERNF